MFETFYSQLEALRIVPVVVLEDAEDAKPLAKALVEAGMKSAEITFRTSAAAKSIAAMREAQPDMCVGAGTIVSVAQAKEAQAVGAQFIVSPGFNPEVVDFCISESLPVLPGTLTPTEIMAARAKGLEVTKFFPAEQFGGLSTISALASAFVGHRFMPTGGISTKNVGGYLANPAVCCCGGTWMVKPALFADHNFEQVFEQAHAAMQLLDA